MLTAEEMRRVDILRKRWVDRYGTLEYFNEWLELVDIVKAELSHTLAMPALPQPRLTDVLRDIAGTRV